jgi:4-amino-4-deoxy-L-arabinose transferase-like glycosyltransferase
MAPPRAFAAWALSGFAVWTAVIVVRYFVVPADLDFVDGELAYPTQWREASVDAARAVLGALSVLLAGRGVSALLPRHLIPAQHPLERLLYLLAVGLLGLSVLFQLAAYLGAYRPLPVAIVVAALALAGTVAAGRDAAQLRVPYIRGADPYYAAVALIAVSTALVGALAPEIEYDALWYHLWLPSQWLAAGRPVDVVEEYVSLYPLSWDLGYGAALAISGQGAAKLLHFACLPLLGATTWRLARELAPGTSATLAAALTVTAPTLLWEATTAYVDLALAWYLALATLALARYHHTNDRRWLWLSALVLGGALAIKHLALVAMAIFAGILSVREWVQTRRLGTSLRTVVLFAALALAVPTPWYARAFAYSGNPVFPDLYSVFGAEPAARWDEVTERNLAGFKNRFGRPRTVANLARLPWDVTMHAARYSGTLGPIFLILIPAALLRGARVRYRNVVFAACAAYLVVWASPISSFQLRFLIPIVPILAVVAAAGAQHLAALGRGLGTIGPRVVTGVLTILLGLNLPFFIEAHDNDRWRSGFWLAHVMGPLPVNVVIGAESREQYLQRRVPSYGAWRFINTQLPAEALILTFSGGDHYYAERPRLWSDATAARPLTWAAPAGSEATVREDLLRRGVTHVLFDRRQLAGGGAEELAITSDRMRRCCLKPVYADDRFEVHEVTGAPAEDTSGTSSAATPAALH